MKKNFFNPYKIKRKWERTFGERRRHLQSRHVEVHEKDFDWRKRRENVFHRTSEEGGHLRMKLSFLCFTLVCLISVLIYHPYFHIQTITLSGLVRVSEQSVRDAVNGLLDTGFVFPTRAYTFVSTDDVEEVLMARFPISHVVVKKEFPNTLHVTVEEKISTIIYNNGHTFAYLNMSGQVVELLRAVGDDEWSIEWEQVTSTDSLGNEFLEKREVSRTYEVNGRRIVAEMGDYPIIYADRPDQLAINDAVLDEATAQTVVNWFEQLQKQFDIHFDYLEINESNGEGTLMTRQGWEMKIRTTGEVESQIDRLKLFLKNSSVNLDALRHVDLRYEGRVYWE